MSDKYKNGKIYTIRCKNDDSLIYVGSTVQPLFKRWFEHKSKANNEKYETYNKLLYQKIRETNNLNDWYIDRYVLYIRMYVCMCVCVYVYVCVHTHIRILKIMMF